jgi:plastocyanin
MRHGRTLTAVLAGVALLSAAPAQAAKTPKKTIRIGDNYYLPDAVKVKRGTVVTWKWPGFDMAGDVHDVKLKSGPKGVKKFHSEPASTDYSFKRKLSKPGKYKIVCTLHTYMTGTITAT